MSQTPQEPCEMSSTSEVGTEKMNQTVAVADQEKPEGAIALAHENGDAYANFQPLLDHYLDDIGLSADDPLLAAQGFTFNENRTKDVPCQFYDGVSEGCWKGPSCPYGHKKFTGGKFAKKHPELALQASMVREYTCISRLPDKPKLNLQMEFKCVVTHANNPSDFYIRPVDPEGAICACKSLEQKIQQLRLIEQKKKEEQENKERDGMEGYDFGFHGVEPQEGVDDDSKDGLLIPLPSKPSCSLEQRMNTYLNRGFNFKKHQQRVYQINVELLAARVNNRWQRAVTLFSGKLEETKGQVRVQLLDTGEKHILPLRDVCQLPERYANEPATTFKGMLARVSPILCIYPKCVVKFFKELVEGKELKAIVKGGVDHQPGKVHGIEPVPYYFKLMYNENGKWMDVAQQLIDEGMVMEWNPFPYRPFVNTVMNTKGLDFVEIPAKRVDKESLERENRRLGRVVELAEDEDKAKEKEQEDNGKVARNDDNGSVGSMSAGGPFSDGSIASR